jgi:hypothetical protein
MRDDADLPGMMLRAAVWRRAPLWLGAALPWCLLPSLPGLLVWALWAGFDFYRLRVRVERDWARWLDAALPELEDSAALLEEARTPVAKLQRRRLLLRAAETLSQNQLASVARDHIAHGYPWLAVSVAAAVATWAWQAPRGSMPLLTVATAAASADELLLRVTPPRYTGVARFETAPRELQVPAQSEVQWCLRQPRTVDAAVELSDGQRLPLGRECAQWRAGESVFWRWRGERYTLRVLPDQAPVVSVNQPKDMVQVLSATSTHAAIAVAVRDDYMVRRATLHLTLARGSGENIRFSDREIPLPVSNDPRVRDWSKQWTLAELGMEPGDELYFFVRAGDNAEPPHQVQSPTYTLRLPGPPAAEDDSSALPVMVKPENLRSQRQIIIDTEQLIADMKVRLPASEAQARSEAIANDQAMLRRRYGQFLGEESSLFGEQEEHENDGSEKGLMAQFGHLHDESESATLFDPATKKVLRRALAAMWDAEKALRAITPRPALAPEHRALEAIKELQQADRIYLHKTAFAPPAIKEEVRLSGDTAGSHSYQRAQGAPPEGLPSELQVLMQALAADAPLPALWSRTAQDWIRSRIGDDEQRLAAQRAVQDVADGCAACRARLRAWLRGAAPPAPVLLQATPVADTPFARAFRKGSAP